MVSPRADQGLGAAQGSLAFMYANGEGVAEDKIEAARWFRLAAEAGDEAAHGALGYMYCLGEGVPVNHIEAYARFGVAHTLGYDVLEPMDNLAAEMTADDVEAGNQRGREILEAMIERG